MNPASEITTVLYRPDDPRYREEIRSFQGCPTVAVTRGGRIYAGWYSGGTREPHPENYNLLVYSDDGGASWSKPLLIIPSDTDNGIHALDIQLWVDPDGRLFVFWVQNNMYKLVGTPPEATPEKPCTVSDGYVFYDLRHTMWAVVCDDPDAADPQFSAPRCRSDIGFLRCKPLVLQDGRWFFCNYDQIDEGGRYGFSISADKGETFTRHYGAKKLSTSFDETMAYQRRDGSIHLLARTHSDGVCETVSTDGGISWSEARPNVLRGADTRFYIGRTPSGRLLAVFNDSPLHRTNLTVCLSEDDGASWQYSRCLDTRFDITYPDVDFHGDEIYLIYDYKRSGDAEINLCRFTEDDIRNPASEIEIRVISSPKKAQK